MSDIIILSVEETEAGFEHAMTYIVSTLINLVKRHVAKKSIKPVALSSCRAPSMINAISNFQRKYPV